MNLEEQKNIVYLVKGGVQLKGVVRLQGSKHSYAAILTAAALSQVDITIENVPNISDAENFIRIMSDVGVPVEKRDQNTVTIKAWSPKTQSVCISEQYVSQLRDSIYLLSFAAIFKEMKIARTFGGCDLGLRPIDAQLSLLSEMGYEVNLDSDWIYIKRKDERISGKSTVLHKSVSVTKIGILLAAFGGKEECVLENIALEPNVFDLLRFLKSIGVEIFFDDYQKISIKRGRRYTNQTSYEIIPDYMEAATIIAAAAITNGQVTISNLKLEHLGIAQQVFEQMGVSFMRGNNGFSVQLQSPKSGLSFTTGYFPQVCTDMHPLIASVLAVSNGVSVIEETVFNNRWKYLYQLGTMGAQFSISENCATIFGSSRFKATAVKGEDIRGTAALILAALNADGESMVSGNQFLLRGYEALPHKLNSLGAHILETTGEH